jgi:hypothetical protein
MRNADQNYILFLISKHFPTALSDEYLAARLEAPDYFDVLKPEIPATDQAERDATKAERKLAIAEIVRIKKAEKANPTDYTDILGESKFDFQEDMVDKYNKLKKMLPKTVKAKDDVLDPEIDNAVRGEEFLRA